MGATLYYDKFKTIRGNLNTSLIHSKAFTDH
jgi:hypothetical protein